MKAITVRHASGKLIAFGPDNGMYDPGVPAGATKRVEPSYDAVLAEWIADRALDTPPPTKEELFLQELTVALQDPSLKALIKEIVKV